MIAYLSIPMTMKMTMKMKTFLKKGLNKKVLNQLNQLKIMSMIAYLSIPMTMKMTMWLKKTQEERGKIEMISNYVTIKGL